MKKSTIAIACALPVCAAASALVSAQRSGEAAQPRVVYRWDVQKSGVSDDLYATSFVDQKLGWAAGDNNTVLKTTDGGTTWTRLGERQEGQNRFESIVFTSATDGWVQGPGGLLYTADGGESWRPATPLPNGAGLGAGSVRGGVRYQLGGRELFRTTDGGATWTALGPVPRNDYLAIFFLDDQHGWVSGGGGHIASTRDGGKTWTEPASLPQRALTEIFFATPQVGWALPHRGHAGGPLATMDGGGTWANQYAAVNTSRPLTDMHFLDGERGFLLAEASAGSTVFHTSNGGKTWRTIGNVAAYSKGLSFPTAEYGWVVGRRGYIVHYHPVKTAR